MQKMGKMVSWPMERLVARRVGLTTSTEGKVVRFWNLMVETKKKVSPGLMV